ncbi:hypothetical protein PY254_10690 [Rhodanobacter sp. AS-Z3]|uniref:hypothetical protein n=1 Tax=Rhodanobacter sp. AS-Z3 TaxID=3031330 RepID=UPI00247A0AAE|nr:hypothetical protein [Rhodanobacter sp. AS-Z3]WEN13712.1 hypothetical protein PY254_10690 [Rhodanobacter sp. AS-Z3]
MIDIIAWLAALVAALTGLAMLQDSTRRPADRSRVGWTRHILRCGLLVFITASAAILLFMPEARTASVYEVAFRCSLTGFMAMQSPCPWWRYVFKGGVKPQRRITDG